MKWEKIVTRKTFLMKNFILYDSLEKDFKKIFKTRYCNGKTIIRDDCFEHYIDLDDERRLSKFLTQKLKQNNLFLLKLHKKGRDSLNDLIDSSQNINNINLKSQSDKELSELFAIFTVLYKKTYPYFVIVTIFSEFEKEKHQYEKELEILTKWRLEARDKFEKITRLISGLLKEIGQRLDINGEDIKSFKPSEIIRLLKKNSKLSHTAIKNIIKERKYCTLYHINGKSSFQLNKKVNVKNKIISISQKIIKGNCANQGRYQGIVRVILNMYKNKHNLKSGEILVTNMTMPEMVPICKKAGAIITDEGGITCHAAIISRELGVPCIIGTKIATKVLKDGDLVEVDANSGIIRKIL